MTSGPAWQKTVLIITFDEWGGFFEHVPPPRAVAPNSVDPNEVNGQVLLGFRVPVIVISPFTRNSGVSHTLFDHTSILKLIEWRWSLPPLTARDASTQIGNLATTMNFAAPDANLPTVPLPNPVFAAPCFENVLGSLTLPAVQRQNSWQALAQSAGVAQ